MKNINDTSNLENVEYPTAEEMSKMTITKEEKYRQQKDKFLEDAFGSLVNAAANGNNSQLFQLHMSDANGTVYTTEEFLDDVQKTFEDLGYRVSVTQSEIKEGIISNLVIEWDGPQ